MMNLILNATKSVPEFSNIEESIRYRRLPMSITGLSHIHKANIISTLCINQKCGAFVVASDESECVKLLNDFKEIGVNALIFPHRDLIFRDFEGISHEYEHQRLHALSSLLEDDKAIIITCPDSALMYTIPPEILKQHTKILASGQDFNVNEAINWMISCGYVRSDEVDGIGQFSVRGGIIDFFAPGHDHPYRLELWGDEIDTISYFDPETQRRIDYCDKAILTPASEVLFDTIDDLQQKILNLVDSLKGKRGSAQAKERLMADHDKIRDTKSFPRSMDKYLPLAYSRSATLFDYLSKDSLLFISDTAKVKERLRASQAILNEEIKSMLSDGTLCRGITEFTNDFAYLNEIYSKDGAVFLESFTRTTYDTPIRDMVTFNARQLSPWSGSIALLKDDLQSSVANTWSYAVLAGTEKAAKNLADDLNNDGIKAKYAPDAEKPEKGCVLILPGTLSGGFEYPGAGFTLITHGRVGVSKNQRRTKHKKGQTLRNLDQLSIGDYVVHSSHGIGIYSGIQKIETQGVTKDYIKIAYDKGDVLYVPVTQLDLVSKYIGPREESGVRLHRLGGQEWQKTRARVKKAVADMAEQLTKLYAQRMKVVGHSFSPDTEFQKDFESHFPYEETDDQLRCVGEIKSDMERVVPMDRLLCGDVGFGKTEVALRAAFKCVFDSKQCAILVPTTILAWQHYKTILQRVEGFPVRVEMLSRFRTAKEQADIIKRVKHGEVDILVGTHRIIQKDIEFKDLGLLIIDEEQRFGVAHKEKLKEKYPNVDCLTLSATPIPRTLNMAMSGMRDMSVIEEAPMDRRPVQTYVLEYDDGIIAHAISRELNRGGQVYYIHNHVESIERCASRLQKLVPQARIGIAHGKMTEEELSEIWRQLLENEIDLLVCTTIIETGVDVPNCNTLIIENADHFGLSQLHQLRGRVGRSPRTAYAYMTFNPGKALSEISTKRLNAIRDFTEFGSGFRIAMRDLEIRGAGNILGAQQHGHMESVGYEMYLRLLNEAVEEQKGEKGDIFESECLVDVRVQAHIPENYIQSNQQRIDIYKRIADIKNDDDASDVIDELIDRFGDPPIAVRGLIDVALLRNTAAQMGIKEIKQNGDNLLFYMRKFDLEMVSKLTSQSKGRIFINAGAKPHLSMRIQPGKNTIDCIREMLELMKECK